MSENGAPRRVGRPPGRANKITRDLREIIEQAFHKAGGRDYLVRVAQRRPDVFLALLGKIIPQETRLSVLASYQAMPIPVEQRDALPQIAVEASPVVLDGVFTAIEAPIPRAPATPTRTPAGDDWLDA